MDNNKQKVIKIIYIYNKDRAHKIIPLISGFNVVIINNIREMLELIKKRSDSNSVIMIDTHGRNGIIGFIASSIMKSPLVIRVRGDLFYERYKKFETEKGLRNFLRYFYSLFVLKICFFHSKMLIFNSKYLAYKMKKKRNKKKYAIVYNPYTPLTRKTNQKMEIFRNVSGLKLLTVTNMNHILKVQPTIEAICNWIDKKTWNELDIHWIICGSGYNETMFKKKIISVGLDQRVHFSGWQIDLTKYYEWCDVLIHLTRMDAFPNVTMEAMSFSKPVITNSDSCGTREQIFEGINGFIINNKKSFNLALYTYAKNELLRIKHGKEGKKIVDNFYSIEEQTKRMKIALNHF